ncbi:uncharacterized protein FTOL_08259 [Fusarium torulosum]|uniref:Uncharacterized protein n=1 Tax=Fusarium torulosum TaxID=33205 RepID=A0AAE8SJT2_9HYPO|nr:uncharacterized protein FTOL_08259 [Fusarium torulosum]
MATDSYSNNHSGEHRRQPILSQNAHKWICCNCGQGWLNVHTDLACPTCQIQRCLGCTYG